MEIWLYRSKLDLKDEDKYKTNTYYEKIIQILSCIYEARENKEKNKVEFILPVHRVVDSIVKFIQDPSKRGRDTLVNVTRWLKNNEALNRT